MDIAYHLILAFIPIFFIGLGIECLFNSDRAYKNNKKQLDAFVRSIHNSPLLHKLTQKRIKESLGFVIILIKIWGGLALLIGLWCLYSLVK